jgi:hypothetical protein
VADAIGDTLKALGHGLHAIGHALGLDHNETDMALGLVGLSEAEWFTMDEVGIHDYPPSL